MFWVNTETFPIKNQFPILITYTVADPDLQIKGGLGHPDPVIRGGGGSGGLKKSFFGPSPFGPQFGKKVVGGGGGWVPWALPLDPQLIYNGKKQLLCFRTVSDGGGLKGNNCS